MMHVFIGFPFFILPGFLLSFCCFPSTSWRIRTLSSILISILLATVLGAGLFHSSWMTLQRTWVIWFCFLSSACVCLSVQKQKCTTRGGHGWLVIGAAVLIGMAVRIFFYTQVKNFATPYDYSASFLLGVPDVGFYTGMIKDHSNYFGLYGLQKVYYYLTSAPDSLDLFLFMLVYSLTVYELLYCVRGKTIACFGTLICAFGPFEIFHSGRGLIGHPLSYIAFLMLFIYFMRPEKGFFWLSLGLAITMALTYYTNSKK
jgi:hypothetical protein